jgi:hypothetical protein
MLPGDSVLGIPSRKSGLVLKLGALLPQYFMNIAVSGKLGVKMFILLPRVDKILKKEMPDVVILYSDSDLSNQKEYTLSVQDKFDVRQHYRNNYTLVVERILATGVKLAISGEFWIAHQCPGRYQAAFDLPLSQYRSLTLTTVRHVGSILSRVSCTAPEVIPSYSHL